MDDCLCGLLQGTLHVFPLRVYYEDTDAGGVVYHASYLRFAERARSEMMRLLGHAVATANEAGMAFAVRRCEVDYLAPARLDDALAVHSRVTDLAGATLTFDQAVRRGEETLVRLKVRVACIRLDSGRPLRIPADVRKTLESYVNG